MAQLERTVGRDRVGLLHLNDSAHGLGSGRDRHAHIGKGELGDAAFARILRDPRWAGLPMVIETPKGAGMEEDKRNLARLRRLAAGRARPGR